MSQKKILVVEDDEVTLELIIENIKSLGSFKIFSATNGQEGFNCCQSEIPDLVISDIFMPVSDGWQLIEMIRECVDTKHIRSIAVSGDGSQREEALKAGFDGFLDKPINRAILEAIVSG